MFCIRCVISSDYFSPFRFVAKCRSYARLLIDDIFVDSSLLLGPRDPSLVPSCCSFWQIVEECGKRLVKGDIDEVPELLELVNEVLPQPPPKPEAAAEQRQ